MILAETIDQLREPLDQAPRPRSREDQELLDLSADCSKTADELLEEFRKVQLNTQGGLRQTLKKSIRAVRRKDYIEQTQEKLDSYRNILHTRLLLRLDGRVVQQREDFSTLDQILQDLVLAVNRGPNAIEQLLSSNYHFLRDHIDKRFDRLAQINHKSVLQQQFMDSLFFADIFVREEQISEEHRGTCQWIFRSQEDWSLESDTKSWPNFVDWLENGDGLYWINGKAGSGKSTLMNYIIHESKTDEALTAWAKGSTLLRPSFFFWSSGAELQKSYAGLLRSLIYQIATKKQDLISILTNADTNFQKAASDSWRSLQIPTWTEGRLSKTLIQFLKNKPTSLSICFFIDGLDEFEGDRDALIELLRSITSTARTKVCFTSRPEQIFRHEFRLVPHLRLQDLNFRDILKTAEDKLRPALQKYAREEGLVDSLIMSVVNHAQGVYLWLDIVIKDIINGARNMDTFGEIRSRVFEIPDTIEGLYKRMLKKLDKQYVSDAIKYFSMLKVTYDDKVKSLTLLDFVLAETVPWERALKNDVSYFQSPDFDDTCSTLETRIITRCAGFVEIAPRANEYLDVRWEKESFDRHLGVRLSNDQEEQNIFRHARRVSFIHKTAHDFLEDHRKSWFRNLKASRVSLVRGWLGSISLIPMAISENVKLGQWLRVDNVEKGLRNLALGEELSDPEEFDRTLHQTATEMVKHAFQIIGRVDATLNGSNIEWHKRYLGWHFDLDPLRILPFHDWAGLAAFLGCTHSVVKHLRESRCDIVFEHDSETKHDVGLASEKDPDFQQESQFERKFDFMYDPEPDHGSEPEHDPDSEHGSDSEQDQDFDHVSGLEHNTKFEQASEFKPDPRPEDCLQELNYLLACTIGGMTCRTLLSYDEIKRREYLVNQLLNNGADPNVKFFEYTQHDVFSDCIFKWSTWGIAFRVAVRLLHEMSEYRMGVSDCEQTALLKQRKRIFMSWINIFLSHNADMNATINWLWMTEDPRHKLIGFEMEGSILSYLKTRTFKSSHACRLAGILATKLRSRGANSQRVCTRIYEGHD